MRLPSLKAFFGLLLITICSLAFGQYTVPQKPAVLYPVNDSAGMLTEQEKQSLNDKLIKFEDSTSTEIVVVIIPTTKGEDVNFLATEYGQKWGVGKDKTDNGIVFLIAKDDHTMAIQQGRGVEQYLTASVAGQILDYIVTPTFKQGLWYEGINRGTTALMEAVQGKFKPEQKETAGGGEISTFKIIFVIFIVLIILRFLFRNRGGGGDDEMITRRGRRTYPGGFFPFPPMGGGFGGGFGGGGFGGGSSGGGFGGFGGGGDFGGGGASGSW